MVSENEKGPSRRTQRMADLIREEIASFLIKGNKDPRIGFVTITEVKITPDLQSAMVYYSAYGSDAEKDETSTGLEESAGRVRAHLAKVLHTRFTPRIEFFIDEGLEKSYRVQELLGKISREEAHGEIQDVDAEEDEASSDDDEEED